MDFNYSLLITFDQLERLTISCFVNQGQRDSVNNNHKTRQEELQARLASKEEFHDAKVAEYIRLSDLFKTKADSEGLRFDEALEVSWCYCPTVPYWIDMYLALFIPNSCIIIHASIIIHLVNLNLQMGELRDRIERGQAEVDMASMDRWDRLARLVVDNTSNVLNSSYGDNYFHAGRSVREIEPEFIDDMEAKVAEFERTTVLRTYPPHPLSNANRPVSAEVTEISAQNPLVSTGMVSANSTEVHMDANETPSAPVQNPPPNANLQQPVPAGVFGSTTAEVHVDAGETPATPVIRHSRPDVMVVEHDNVITEIPGGGVVIDMGASTTTNKKKSPKVRPSKTTASSPTTQILSNDCTTSSTNDSFPVANIPPTETPYERAVFPEGSVASKSPPNPIIIDLFDESDDDIPVDAVSTLTQQSKVSDSGNDNNGNDSNDDGDNNDDNDVNDNNNNDDDNGNDNDDDNGNDNDNDSGNDNDDDGNVSQASSSQMSMGAMEDFINSSTPTPTPTFDERPQASVDATVYEDISDVEEIDDEQSGGNKRVEEDNEVVREDDQGVEVEQMADEGATAADILRAAMEMSDMSDINDSEGMPAYAQSFNDDGVVHFSKKSAPLKRAPTNGIYPITTSVTAQAGFHDRDSLAFAMKVRQQAYTPDDPLLKDPTQKRQSSITDHLNRTTTQPSKSAPIETQSGTVSSSSVPPTKSSPVTQSERRASPEAQDDAISSSSMPLTTSMPANQSSGHMPSETQSGVVSSASVRPSQSNERQSTSGSHQSLQRQSSTSAPRPQQQPSSSNNANHSNPSSTTRQPHQRPQQQQQPSQQRPQQQQQPSQQRPHHQQQQQPSQQRPQQQQPLQQRPQQQQQQPSHQRPSHGVTQPPQRAPLPSNNARSPLKRVADNVPFNFKAPKRPNTSLTPRIEDLPAVRKDGISKKSKTLMGSLNNKMCPYCHTLFLGKKKCLTPREHIITGQCSFIKKNLQESGVNKKCSHCQTEFHYHRGMYEDILDHFKERNHTCLCHICSERHSFADIFSHIANEIVGSFTKGAKCSKCKAVFVSVDDFYSHLTTVHLVKDKNVSVFNKFLFDSHPHYDHFLTALLLTHSKLKI